jgi:Domain of unknown function (DUF305)
VGHSGEWTLISHGRLASTVSLLLGSPLARIRKLADQIIESQVREIQEMKQLIADLEQNPVPADTPDLPAISRQQAARTMKP